jgi:signal transduction histidine kinase
MAVSSSSTLPAESAAPSPIGWIWRRFPAFWTALLAGALALDTLSVVTLHPERVQGWRPIGLSLLLIAFFIGYRWLSWRRIYRDAPMPTRHTLLAVGMQLLALLLLVWEYDASFAWFSLALLYEIIGALPRRQWPLPLAGVLLVLAATIVPASGAPLDPGTVVGTALLLIMNGGVAIFIRLLHDQRDQLRVALAQLREAHAQLAASAAQQQELAVLRERERLARAMHDDLGHALVVMNVKLEAARLLYQRDPARGDAELEATRTLIRSTMAELRRALAGLRAPAADRGNLPAAIEQLCQKVQARSSIAVACHVAPDLRTLPDGACEALWYVAREALANVERHAAATSAALTLEQGRDGWLLRVADDGAGITPAEPRRPGHYGLVGMRERMHAVGGTFSVRRGTSGGTIVEVRLPAQVTEEARTE